MLSSTTNVVLDGQRDCYIMLLEVMKNCKKLGLIALLVLRYHDCDLVPHVLIAGFWSPDIMIVRFHSLMFHFGILVIRCPNCYNYVPLAVSSNF